MSDVLARYHFLSWARRGVAASLDNPDSGTLPARASLNTQLSLSVRQGGSTNVVQPPPVNVQMFGPGDVIGIDPRHVIRTEPRPFTVNYEPNYLCGIEFDMPDFPWLFTPAKPNGDRLRPWLALIALKPSEFKMSPVAPNPLPVVEVQTLAPLPNLSESWNWAHVQVSGDTPLATVLNSSPGSVISRLLCPRRLDPETQYTVFLVPAFEIGRKAGLGQDVAGVTTSDPSWTSATPTPLGLPFYFQFQFTTSDEGDFESLVCRLKPRVLPAEVGQRPMDVSQPQNHIASAGPPLGLEGALHSISTEPTPWNDPDKTAFQTDVEAFINQPAAFIDDPENPLPDDPVIVPPIYGRWHAAVQSVSHTASGWVNELNLDPRNRSGAGMGTQVVQIEHTQLMAAAWQQVDGVLKANQVLRQAQLARAALQQMFRQHYRPVLPETAMVLTAPLHARLMASPLTIRATVRASRVPERMLSATFRRATRPRRRIGSAPNRRPSLLGRVNSGELTFVPPVKPPDGLVSIEEVSDHIATPADQNLVNRWRWILLALIVIVLVLAGVALFVGSWPAVVAVIAAGVSAGAALWSRARAAIERTTASKELRVSGFTPEAAASLPDPFGFQITPAGAPDAASGGGADSATAAAFRSATKDLFTFVQKQPVDPPQAPALEMAALKTTLMTRLDPAVTVPRRMKSLVSLAPGILWRPPDAIEPIMAAPEFPQPMYAPLRDLSPQYVLPGVDLVPPDTLGILLTNPAFIEAYMTGLNHEMARHLLWNDYPTDQRGSYFRQFWDVSAYVRQPTDPADPAALKELLKDIPLIHTWSKSLALGAHPNRTDVALNNVVLLVRGELLKRYPNTVIYAGKAKRDGATRILDETDERYPIFRGTLPDDLTFFGFNLSLDDARGGTSESPEGFFFVFQEQPTEPRFGAQPAEHDTPTKHWANLAWTNFAGGGSEPVFGMPDVGNTTRGKTLKNAPWRLASQVFSMVLGSNAIPDFLSPAQHPNRMLIVADTDNPVDPNNQWGVNSAQTAYILLRVPFRILIHADLMIPPR